ncbi:hypothetical protein [Arthrobacter sp. fls2-241-R2A-200]|uniref:hypothetical protein n=1 Tax=unclassified Arthrobacter TaxID=235627 RepID=UPI00254AB18E|nr:hypothetical protein [Arthrobacter sp. fls2-241-R2A-200]
MTSSADAAPSASSRQNPDRKNPDSKHVRSAEDFDIIIGLLGFWGLVLLVVTVAMELTGQPALGWALGLLAIVLALWGMFRLRKKLPPRTTKRLK